MDFFQNIILSKGLILFGLLAVFAALARWALIPRNGKRSHMKGFGLGLLLGLFFIIVRVSVSDIYIGTTPDPDTPRYLEEFQVYVATLLGLGAGSLVLVGFKFGMGTRRAVGIQVAFYTAVIIIMAFMVFISNPIIQKMIGIFALAIGIATLFALVLLAKDDEEEQVNIQQPGGTGASQPVNPGQGGGGTPNKLSTIRKNQQDRWGRRR